MNVIETDAIGRRYGSRWALQDCSLNIPEGHLVALVGPNGSGKSTLLNLLVGLTEPTTGTVTVLGAPAGSTQALDGVAFVAQNVPLYGNLTAGDMARMTRSLNADFDSTFARQRLDALGIDLKQKSGRLSGGQQAQLALTLALARHPRLLVLDEPTAPLDPLARHDFMAIVMAAMADDGVSVILSSHMLAELERVADYLVLLCASRVRVAGSVDDLLAEHRLVTSATAEAAADDYEVVETVSAGGQTHRLVRLAAGDRWEASPGSAVRPVGIEELSLAYLRQSPAGPALAQTGASSR